MAEWGKALLLCVVAMVLCPALSQDGEDTRLD